MHLIIFAVGKLKKNATSDLFDHYYHRISNIAKTIGVSKFTIKAVNESKAAEASLRQKEEGKKLLELINKDAKLIICDEIGANLSSKEFSALLQKELNSAKSTLVFAIGGADGFSEEVKQAAAQSISFGRCTWPHQLVRIMLAEQIYRAMTIVLNHPYHRE